ncbi:hypothetical protein PHLCEN_2v4674 [Hermanssonia centrifuga]|uniref:Uncharacterized protein n=1 Tax=Hermanssonia centrifuga TaxID=98765 RepID=A0A2R6PMZ0_9APHY|nr:hypothetical protein PHLCEN_2v4674 [Hermanssonia centrifuga]
MLSADSDQREAPRQLAPASSFGASLIEKLRVAIHDSLAAFTGYASSSQPSQSEDARVTSDSNGALIHEPSVAIVELSPAEQRERHKTVMASRYGIRVRDFAYESKLPPVPSYRPPVQVGPRTLKRTRRDYEQTSDVEEDYGVPFTPDLVSSSPRRVKKSKPLQRELTEPVVSSQSQQATGYEFPVQSMRIGCSTPRNGAYLAPSTPPRLAIQVPTSSFSPMVNSMDTFSTPPSQPGLDESSQETEPWVDTPLVTPNGSYQFKFTDTSAVPASQLGDVLPEIPKTSFPQLGLIPLLSSTSLRRGLQRSLSRISGTSSPSRSSSFRQIVAPKSRSRANTRKFPSLSPSTSRASLMPRYHLRNRAAVTSPSRPSGKARRDSHTAAASPSRKQRSPLSKNMQGSVAKLIPVLRRSARKAERL